MVVKETDPDWIDFDKPYFLIFRPNDSTDAYSTDAIPRTAELAGNSRSGWFMLEVVIVVFLLWQARCLLIATGGIIV